MIIMNAVIYYNMQGDYMTSRYAQRMLIIVGMLTVGVMQCMEEGKSDGSTDGLGTLRNRILKAIQGDFCDEKIVQDCSEVLNARVCQEQGETPLTCAVRLNKPDIAGRLIDGRADLSVPNREGHLPIVYAALLNHAECVNIICTKRTEIVWKPFNICWAAVINRDASILKRGLSSQSLSDTTAALMNNGGFDLAVITAYNEGNSEALDKLHEHGYWLYRKKFRAYESNGCIRNKQNHKNYPLTLIPPSASRIPRSDSQDGKE